VEETAILDGIVGVLAIAILLGGLVMLFQGVSAMNRKQ
jgi:hypothetical protein